LVGKREQKGRHILGNRNAGTWWAEDVEDDVLGRFESKQDILGVGRDETGLEEGGWRFVRGMDVRCGLGSASLATELDVLLGTGQPRSQQC
jgi:hypothetical protein